MDSPFDISGRVILVTGSSRGIGRGIAEHMAEQGASLVVHGRSEEALGPVVAAVEAAGAPVLGVVADIRDAAQLASVSESIHSRFGRLDGLVANVGGALFGAADTLEVERFRRQLDLNLTGAFATAQAVQPLLRESSGAIVFIAATAATNPTPLFAAYGAAKAGLAQLTGSLAAEWGPRVRVNCVSGGSGSRGTSRAPASSSSATRRPSSRARPSSATAAQPTARLSGSSRRSGRDDQNGPSAPAADVTITP